MQVQFETETLIQRWRRIAPSRVTLTETPITPPKCFTRAYDGEALSFEAPLRAPVVEGIALVLFTVAVFVGYTFAVWGV